MPIEIFTSHILFFLLAGLAVVLSALVVVARNPVTSAMWMALSFVAVAAILFGLGAHFLGVIQILVYAGAIMVLFVFIVMLLNINKEEKAGHRILPTVLACLAATTFMAMYVGVVGTIPVPKSTVCSTDACKEDKCCPMMTSLCDALGDLRVALPCCDEPKDAPANAPIQQIPAVVVPEVVAVDLIAAHAAQKTPTEAEEAIHPEELLKLADSDPQAAIDKLGKVVRSTPTAIPVPQAPLPTYLELILNPDPTVAQVELPAIDPKQALPYLAADSQVAMQVRDGRFPDTALLGMTLFGKYLNAFILAGFALLVATIGAVVLCRRPEKK